MLYRTLSGTFQLEFVLFSQGWVTVGHLGAIQGIMRVRICSTVRIQLFTKYIS
jgi:hypothetical protein